MKLYATITSERATKGQGGEYLQIDITDSEKILIAHFDVTDTEEGYIITHDIDHDRVILEAEQTKGEKQKGEVCGLLKGYDVCDKLDCNHPLLK